MKKIHSNKMKHMKNYTIKPYKQMQILQKDYIKTPLITLFMKI